MTDRWWEEKRIAAERWRNRVLENFNNRCADCGSVDKLEAHHIVPVAELPSAAFVEFNGVCLCRKCHQNTDSWGGWKKRPESLGITQFIIKTIPEHWQSYDTVGNYFETEDDCIVILVSELEDQAAMYAIIIHELVESMLCRHRGISFESIDEFDTSYKGDGEPGNEPGAPYHKEHRIADIIERMYLHELNQDYVE